VYGLLYRRRTEGLKACLKRKKVAFQLFKAWYWDAFDSDVQVSAMYCALWIGRTQKSLETKIPVPSFFILEHAAAFNPKAV
jgi:hypothetical protein